MPEVRYRWRRLAGSSGGDHRAGRFARIEDVGDDGLSWGHVGYLPTDAWRVASRRLSELRTQRPPDTDALSGFVEDLNIVTNIVDPWSLYRAYRRRERPQYGEAAGFFYFIHGIGCKVTDADGVEVDVDFDEATGDAIFDAWRVQQYANSRWGAEPDPEWVERQLLRAISDGVVAGHQLAREASLTKSDCFAWFKLL